MVIRHKSYSKLFIMDMYKSKKEIVLLEINNLTSKMYFVII